MLLGRANEVAEIDAALAETAQGRGRLLVFVGEAGIGKTRLADEATARARALGLVTTWGRTWEGAGAPPNWAWTQIVRALLAEGAVKLAPSEAADLAPLVPESSRARGRASDATGFRAYDALVRVLKRATRSSPRVIVLDDLHGADRATLTALHFVARALRDLPVMIVATHRDADARVRPDAHELLERIAREGTRFALARLGEADVATLLDDRVGRAVGTRAAHAVFRSTEGNPLFVHELARFLAHAPKGATDAIDHLPDGIRTAVDEHVSLLSPPTRALLGGAALFGRDFADAALATVAEATRDDVDRALAEAATSGVIARVADRASFTHILLAEALARALAPSVRASLHARIAAWWDASAERDARLAEIAHHRLEADGDRRDAVDAAKRAAEEAVRHLAFDSAADLYARALAFAPSMPDSTRIVIGLMVGRAEALARGGVYAEGLALCKEAATKAIALGAPDLQARAALACASYFNFMVPDPDVVALLERALANIGGEHDALRASLLAKLSSTRYPSPIPDATLTLAREAEAVARRVGDPKVLLAVLYETALSGLPQSLAIDERAARGRELHALAIELDDTDALHRAQVSEVVNLVSRGEVGGLDEKLDTLEAHAKRSGAPREAGLVCLTRAMCARFEGRYAEADARIEQATHVAVPEDLPRIRMIHLWAQAYTRRGAADLEALARAGPIRMPSFGGAWLAAASGQRVEALRHLRAPLPTGDHAWPTMIAALADACVLARDAVAAEPLYRLLLPAAGECLIFGPVICVGPADRILGGLAALRGDRDAATAHYDRALAMAERMRATPFVERIHAERRDLLHEAAPPNHTPSAPIAPRDTLTLTSDGDTWMISLGADTVRLRDSKGLAYLAELVRAPEREIHATEIYTLGAGAAEIADAGPVLDAVARERYERRLEDLEDQLREAEAFGDKPRASRAEEEIDALAEELARAVGLGGRDRRAASLTERARVNVQRRLKDVVARAHAAAPAIGRHLATSIKTGAFCSYRPPSS